MSKTTTTEQPATEQTPPQGAPAGAGNSEPAPSGDARSPRANSPAYDPLRELAAKLRESPTGESPTGVQPTDGDRGGEAGAKPKDLNGLAEKLGLKVADLYAVEIPSAREGAEPFTLGKLKDLAAEHDAFTLRQLNFEQGVQRKESELNRLQGELKLLMSGLPQEALKPEVMDELRARYTEQVNLERAKLLKSVPEWNDEDAEEKDRAAMGEHLVDHGFPKGALDRITDSALLKYVRWNMLREKQIAKALEEVSERQTQTPGRSQRETTRGGQQPRRSTQPARPGRTQRRVASFIQTIEDAANQ